LLNKVIINAGRENEVGRFSPQEVVFLMFQRLTERKPNKHERLLHKEMD